MNEYSHLTLPFHFNSEIKQVDLQTFQFPTGKTKPLDLQVMNSEKGKFILKKMNQTNIIFRMRKFQHKNDPNIVVYKLEHESEINETYDSQYYFQDFYFEGENDQNILNQFKKYIQCKPYQLEKQHVPRDIAKPFCWRGSNFKINLMKKYVKRNKVEKKNFITPLKFGEAHSNLDEIYQETDPTLNQLFQKKPIWLKKQLIKELKQFQQYEEKLGQMVYYYYNGPWAKCYVLKQFNPQLNSIAAKYQTINIKNNQNEDSNSEDQDYPQKCFTLLQLCDLQDKDIDKIIQEAINKGKQNPPSAKDFEKYGWFEKQQMKIIVRKIKSLRQHQNKQ
ncbi:unnamed protein product (macronuclear) [Paramecium tetraurelia]|uniref:Transcription factor IIIC subunit 5 HTH domain-containing protein n=1 Tax=Paramecium tetraurelia TaxID=5888 RepID=A0C7C1_PARTE|nr:uncharacterized protein GSPATT00035818001 [Paramecium tetraurelia]CAK66688.1 unnamed protein product [Paramecium tetraurelia]|eukprot:XP_001434085.1 hypothetical protein (macronuclear) [Paramecium tetraurelia strain d4-2]